MARPELRLDTNTDGDFFVDSSCIDCDACRQIAPSTFVAAGGQSAVTAQPRGSAELLAAQRALLSCPTASIGDLQKRSLQSAIESLPHPVDDEVSWCGYTAESSFGAFSYFVERVEGNLLIDSPRFTEPLAKRLDARGGIHRLLLTHRDDVADHAQFRTRFGCERVLHRDDVTRSTAEVELQPSGLEPVTLDPDLVMIPVPGHTRGHAVFLYRNRFLFTGDHLAWSVRRGRLIAFRDACWYSWAEQTRSMRALLDFTFEWVLPGHGRPVHLPAADMRRELERCVEWMASF